MNMEFGTSSKISSSSYDFLDCHFLNILTVCMTISNILHETKLKQLLSIM